MAVFFWVLSYQPAWSGATFFSSSLQLLLQLADMKKTFGSYLVRDKIPSDGVGRTGAFITFYAQMESEAVVDMFQYVHQSHQNTEMQLE